MVSTPSRISKFLEIQSAGSARGQPKDVECSPLRIENRKTDRATPTGLVREMRAAQRAVCVGACGMIVALAWAQGASAQNRIFDLYLANGANNPPVTFKIGREQNCYEGLPAAGQQVGAAVNAGERVPVRLARVQGNNCDGEMGVFAIEFSEAGQPPQRVWMHFDNSGNLAMREASSSAFGVLSAKSRSDESYTWTTHGRELVTAGRTRGDWNKVCQQFCIKKFRTEIINTTTNSKETSSEVRDAISATLNGGVELGAFSAGASMTAETERTVGQSMRNEISMSNMSGNELDLNMSRAEMEALNLFAIWQWVGITEMSNGDDMVLTTVQYTCTPDAVKPTYLPGSAEDIQACRAKAAVTPPTAAPVAAIPSRRDVVASAGAQTDVTDFVLLNDSNDAWAVAWIDGNGSYTPNVNHIVPGQSWVVANGAKTWESHWFAITTDAGFRCSISLRQGVRAKFSELAACQ
jgi:hypothetical protein